jgi:hypothetical protein
MRSIVHQLTLFFYEGRAPATRLDDNHRMDSPIAHPVAVSVGATSHGREVL